MSLTVITIYPDRPGDTAPVKRAGTTLARALDALPYDALTPAEALEACRALIGRLCRAQVAALKREVGIEERSAVTLPILRVYEDGDFAVSGPIPFEIAAPDVMDYVPPYVVDGAIEPDDDQDDDDQDDDDTDTTLAPPEEVAAHTVVTAAKARLLED